VRREAGFRSALQKNGHEIYVLEAEELLALHLDRQISANKLSKEDADEILAGAAIQATPKQKEALTDYLFNKYSSYIVGNVGTWQSTVVLQKMYKDIGGLGEIILKNNNGKTYVVFKGYPGLRATLTGTRYLATHPKVITMGFGHVSRARLAVAGARVTFIAVLAYRFLEFLLTDEMTVGKLLGYLASDVVKIAISVGAGYLAMAVAGTFMSIALGPLVAAVIVGLVVSGLLEYYDNGYGITEQLANAMETLLKDIGRKAINASGDKIASLAYPLVDIAIEWLTERTSRYVRHQVDRLIGPGLW
jgi:hypothetical protein